MIKLIELVLFFKFTGPYLSLLIDLWYLGQTLSSGSLFQKIPRVQTGDLEGPVQNMLTVNMFSEILFLIIEIETLSCDLYFQKPYYLLCAGTYSRSERKGMFCIC